jgi:signal transduction histidine kinase
MNLENAGSLTVRVSDTGIGITPEDFPRIFEPGFSRRAHGHAAGTGMGLTIAKETFDRLGWKIDIKSTVGNGTEVTISIQQYVF